MTSLLSRVQVHNLIAINGPQSGVGECPAIEWKPIKSLCGSTGTAIGIYHWPYCSFCSYWKVVPLTHTCTERERETWNLIDRYDTRTLSHYHCTQGSDQKEYLENSQWLAGLNNEKEVNSTRRERMISLNSYMATYATEDHIVQPPQSAWHTYWAWGDTTRGKVQDFRDTDGYKRDLLGLKSLDLRGSLFLNHFEGGHVGYNISWWNETVLPLFQ